MFLQPQRGDGALKHEDKEEMRKQNPACDSSELWWYLEWWNKKVPIIFTIASTIKDTRSDFQLCVSFYRWTLRLFVGFELTFDELVTKRCFSSGPSDSRICSIDPNNSWFLNESVQGWFVCKFMRCFKFSGFDSNKTVFSDLNFSVIHIAVFTGITKWVYWRAKQQIPSAETQNEIPSTLLKSK